MGNVKALHKLVFLVLFRVCSIAVACQVEISLNQKKLHFFLLKRKFQPGVCRLL